jgi:ribonuclease I
MDSIRIVITRNCDEQGSGGTVVDNAAAVLGSIGQTKVLDALVAAFADAYGLHEVDGVAVTPERNMTYRMRMFATEIVTAYMQKMAAEQARQQAGQQTQAALGATTIVENI